MRLRSITLFHVAVPLRSRIKHASHERTVSDNLIVRASLDSGFVGYGEGVPRSYVTGETIPSTLATLERLDAGGQIGNPTDFEAAVAKIAALTLPEIEADPRGMAGNAARSALELALLDAYGRAFGRSVSDAVRIMAGPGVSIRDRPGSVRYSGAITASSPRKERGSALKMRVYGFHQVKIKVGVEGQDDPRRLATLRTLLGRKMDIRIDANEAWSVDRLLEQVWPLLPARLSALEQPVPHADVDGLAAIRPRLGVPIMLDESLCGYPDAEAAVARRTADILNVRISKCGGIGPSLRIIGLAGRSGLDVQLGCHPGETGLLSAAGRHLAANVAGIRYLEGSYDRHVLGENVIVEDITFGYGGRAQPLSGPGLGVTVDPAKLEAMTRDRREVRYDG